MITSSKTKAPITSITHWGDIAGPKSKKQWKEHRSAYEVARVWINASPKMPTKVLNLIENHKAFGPVRTWRAVPEMRLRFDKLAGEPRNSDLAVWVDDASGSYFVAVEAKADEPYGAKIEGQRRSANTALLKNSNSKGIDRLKALMGSVLGAGPSPGTTFNHIRYQLLTATAGCLATARERGMGRAVLLIHEFRTVETDDPNHERNGADLANFISILAGRTISKVEDGKLYGPYRVSYAPDIEFYVGKVIEDTSGRPLRREG